MAIVTIISKAIGLVLTNLFAYVLNALEYYAARLLNQVLDLIEAELRRLAL